MRRFLEVLLLFCRRLSGREIFERKSLASWLCLVEGVVAAHAPIVGFVILGLDGLLLLWLMMLVVVLLKMVFGVNSSTRVISSVVRLVRHIVGSVRLIRIIRRLIVVTGFPRGRPLIIEMRVIRAFVVIWLVVFLLLLPLVESSIRSVIRRRCIVLGVSQIVHAARRWIVAFLSSLVMPVATRVRVVLRVAQVILTILIHIV